MNVTLSIISWAGTLASILTLLAELLRWHLSRSPRRTRMAVAVIVLMLSVAAGMTPPRSEPPPAVHHETSVVLNEVYTAPPELSGIAPPPPAPARKEPPVDETAPRRAAERSEIALGHRERAMPEVVAAADDVLTMLQSEPYTVRGALRGVQSAPDAALAGIVTTDLTLDVRLVNTDGIVVDAFTITSRGGGFTADDSGLQARERLRAALRKRIAKEY